MKYTLKTTKSYTRWERERGGVKPSELLWNIRWIYFLFCKRTHINFITIIIIAYSRYFNYFIIHTIVHFASLLAIVLRENKIPIYLGSFSGFFSLRLPSSNSQILLEPTWRNTVLFCLPECSKHFKKNTQKKIQCTKNCTCSLNEMNVNNQKYEKNEKKIYN